MFLKALQDFIDKRHEEMPEGSYTTSLFESGINKIAPKVGEEAVETVIEATNGTNERLIYEGADLIYHMTNPSPQPKSLFLQRNNYLMVIPSPQRYDFNSGILISPK